ncbi:MAG: FHA domain-containing protein [Bdellovibrionota bacterium]
MFALEIEFHDGISAPETILVRRTNSIIGSGEQAHVVIEGAASSACEMRLIRGIGREFRCQPVRRPGQEAVALPFLEGSYRGNAELKLGEVTCRVTSLDLDLCLTNDDIPDRAALRVLQRAMSEASPLFPAVAVHGANPVFLSFRADQPLLVGRSRKCGLRLDASDVSSEHARMGIEGNRVWVEDLGSTNGTSVGNARISGRHFLEPGETVQIGSEFTLSVVMNVQDVADVSGRGHGLQPSEGEHQGYPCIISTSELIRPNRVVFPSSGQIHIGRDPANDVWLNAPHVSRQHLTVQWTSPEHIVLIDSSSNGTYVWGERLPKGEPLVLPQGLAVLDFCSGLTAAICRGPEEERAFLKNPSATNKAAFEAKFNAQEAGPTEYRGAQAGKMLQAWEDFAEPKDRELKKPPSVFEKLAQKHANQAQVAEQIASEPEAELEEEVYEQPSFEQEPEDEPPLFAEPLPTETVAFGKLSGILEAPEREVSTELQPSMFDDRHVEVDEVPQVVDDLLLPEDYEGTEFVPPGTNSLLKVILIGAGVLLVGFILLLVFGFFSSNMFY